MRRPNREINVFNMSMLDVICSALGAILILFIISLEAQQKSQASAEDWQQKYQTLEEKVKAQQEAMAAEIQAREQALKSQQSTLRSQRQAMAAQRQAMAAQLQKMVSQEQTVASQKKTIAEQAKELEEAIKKAGGGTGMAIGMCEVDKATVQISVYDHGSEDDDRVELKLNKKMLSKSMVIRNQPTSKSINLKHGVNYLVVKALNEGNSSPNTATLVIDPCNNGGRESFIWEMKQGQVRNISIVRK